MSVVRGVVSILLIVYLISIPDWSVLANLDGKTYFTLVFTITLTFVVLVFMSLRWQLLTRIQTSVVMSFSIAYKGYLSGLFYNIFMPGAIGGDLYRIKYCSDQCDISLKRSGIIVATERMFGILALVTYLFIGLGFGGGQVLLKNFEHSLLISGLVAIAAMIVVFSIVWKRLNLETLDIFRLYLLSLLSQGIYLIASILILHAIVSNAESYWILIAMPFAFIATVLPISIGGLGVREGVLVSIFLLFGINLGEAVIVSILAHLINVIAGASGFACLLLFSRFNNRKKLTL